MNVDKDDEAERPFRTGVLRRSHLWARVAAPTSFRAVGYVTTNQPTNQPTHTSRTPVPFQSLFTSLSRNESTHPPALPGSRPWTAQSPAPREGGPRSAGGTSDPGPGPHPRGNHRRWASPPPSTPVGRASSTRSVFRIWQGVGWGKTQPQGWRWESY